MNRRTFLCGLTFATLTAPFSAKAQQTMTTLAERAAAIEQAWRAPDGDRVVVGHLSRALRLPAETLRTQRAQTGLGWGELLIAHRLSKEAGLALDAVVAEFRSGRSWEQIARDHAVNLDTLRRDVQWSREMVEQRAEDKPPQHIQLEGGTNRPSSAPSLPGSSTGRGRRY